MSFKVTIHSNQSSFQVKTDETVLEAALNQGVNLPYGCRNGFCGACKGQIISGQVSYSEQPEKLSDEDIDQGFAFLCSCFPESDLEIDIELVEETSDIEIKTLPCRVQSIEKMSNDVIFLSLKLPAEERLQFLPGQYIDILLEDGRKRSFSLANPPHKDEFLELHIRHVPGGIFTDHVFSSMKKMDILRIEGPHGNFFYRENTDRAMIFMAGGTGFAPIKSIIEHLIAEKITQPIYLYWGVRTQADLYMNELAIKWEKDYPNIHYIPILSNQEHSTKENKPAWNGKTGYVHQAICDDFSDLSEYDIYACGPPIMITSAEESFKQQGLTDEHFFSDSFDYAEQGEK
ncbi:MAG: CDP-6-deoxy-delta-3,4-glucoseen reductase [Pseudomonadota bacterium]